MSVVPLHPTDVWRLISATEGLTDASQQEAKKSKGQEKKKKVGSKDVNRQKRIMMYCRNGIGCTAVRIR